MITLSLPQLTSISGPLLTLARLWDLRRIDCKALYLTDHDRPITIGMKTYFPNDSLAASAQVKGGGFKERDREVAGVLSSDLIKEEDILAGLYRDAQILESLVDWENIGGGQFLQEVYWIKDTSSTGEVFKANIDGLSSFVKLPFGENYTRDCNHILGDGLCQVDIDALMVTGYISEVTSGEGYSGQYKTNIATQPFANFYWNGKIKFTSGANTGLTYIVKSHSVPSGVITQWLEPIFIIEEGDEFELYPGCDKTRATCSGTFDNLINHGGFPFLVGNDRMVRSPDYKS